MHNNIQKAYKEILNIVKKHKDICIYNLDDMETKAKNHLFGIELKEKYGLKLNPKNITSLNYNKFGNYMNISRWGKKFNRSISWSDDNRQPTNELLLVIEFSTGAYIFGRDYPKDLFQEFWQKLKSYKPKYCDSVNNKLYFSIKKASKIFNSFNSILEKYHEKNKIDYKERKIKRIKEELKQLENKNSNS